MIPLPAKYVLRTKLAAGAHHEVWRGAVGGQDAAVRVVSFAGVRGPMTDPADFARRMDEIARGLGLTTFAPLLAAEPLPDGVVLAEPWAGDRALGGLAWQDVLRTLGPALEDLTRLHQAGKWHGGLRASRLVVRDAKVTVTSFTWSVVSATFTRELRAALEPPLADDPVAPELRAKGPAGAGPALDSWGLARALLAATTGPIPPKARAILDRASSADPAQRPPLRELLAALQP